MADAPAPAPAVPGMEESLFPTGGVDANALDAHFTLLSGYLVFFMHCG